MQTEVQKLSVTEKIGYSLGDLAANLIFQTLMTFLAFFYTDVYQIPAGAAATISSPAVDFKRHAQSVQDLIIKAYKQCKRFFDYLYSAEEVPLYNRVNGKYEECGRIRHSKYRVMIPIGLTVESFSPFSSFCKELPIIEPLLNSCSE